MVVPDDSRRADARAAAVEALYQKSQAKTSSEFKAWVRKIPDDDHLAQLRDYYGYEPKKAEQVILINRELTRRDKVREAKPQWLGIWLATVMSLCSLLVAAFSVYQTTTANSSERTEYVSTVYLELRDRFAEIKQGLPKDYSADGQLPDKDSPEWVSYELYWQHAFDEWFVTTQLDVGAVKQLWPKFYEPIFIDVLKSHGPLRHAACVLTSEESEFGRPFREEFRETLDSLYANADSICDQGAA